MNKIGTWAKYGIFALLFTGFFGFLGSQARYTDNPQSQAAVLPAYTQVTDTPTPYVYPTDTPTPYIAPTLYVQPVQQQVVNNGATALCSDGTLSYSASRRGTCSHHGGVSEWY